MKITNQNKLRQHYTPAHDSLKAVTKKEQILELWNRGDHDIWHIADEMDTTSSYVASVLQASGLISGYYDLYTSAPQLMNIYSEKFKGKLGFKNIESAQSSLKLLDESYLEFAARQDRAGQHHCMVAAMTMFNRALSIGKMNEAEVFRKWLVDRLNEHQRSL